MTKQNVENDENPVPEHAGGWRLKLGVAIFALSILAPAAGIPLVNASDLSGKLVVSLSGALLAAGEVLGLAAVAVMGKPGYEYIKGMLFAVLRRFGPPETVSRNRYRAGLFLFCIPLFFAWVAPYVTDLISLQEHLIIYAIAGDALLLVSLFVLGGDFWDKLRSLFVHDQHSDMRTSKEGAER